MTTTPHDALFKAAFSRPEQAAELLRSLLDPALAARIDWSTLTLHPGSFVDEALQAQHTDLLFTASLDGQDIRIYLLFEHQSASDPWIALWLLRYMVQIWVRHVDADSHARRLPPILPAVIHHGDRGWSIDPQFSALIDIPADLELLHDFTPHFQFAFTDLAVVDADTLRTRGDSAATRVVLLALKQTRAAQHVERLLADWSTLLNQLEREPDGPRAIQLVFSYLLAVRDAHEFEHLDLRALGLGQTSEAMMTREAYLLDKGERRGCKTALLELLKSKFSCVSPAVLAAIEAADAATLQRWILRVMHADSLEAVFADTAA